MNTLPVAKRYRMVLTAFMSTYMTFVFLSKKAFHLLYKHIELQTAIPVEAYLLFGVLFFSTSYAVLSWLTQNIQTMFFCSRNRGKLSYKLFLFVALVAFVLNSAHLAGRYPGGLSPDTEVQWTQAHTMEFNNHHPFFHTWLFWFLTSIRDSYTFMLLVQITFFSLALGYFAATMYAWGFKLSLVLLLCGIIILNTQTRILLLYFWKDTALSIFFLFFLSHIFNIFLSNGEWLKKRSHWLGTAILLACITIIRFNAVLFTVPLLVLMLLFLTSVRKFCIKIVLAMLVLIIIVNGPLQSAYHVTAVNNGYRELIGMPMTILLSVYTESPDTTPAETCAFMNQFGTLSELRDNYEFGDFNSAKWSLDFSVQKFEQIPLSELLKTTYNTYRSNTILATLGVLELTDIVWDPIGTHYDYTKVAQTFQAVHEPLNQNIQTFCSEFFDLLDGLLHGSLFQKATTQIGILILIMLISLYLSIQKFRGWSALWLVLPIMFYNFGTMLLLCGNDYRFFHFNCLAAWPLSVLLLSRSWPIDDQNEACKSP